MDDLTKQVLAEKWEADGDGVKRVGAEHERGYGYVGDFDVGEQGGGYATNDARARFASCAPEALALLLELEWCGENKEDDLYCPSCAARWPRGAWQSQEHKTDCSWLLLMRKAGLR